MKNFLRGLLLAFLLIFGAQSSVAMSGKHQKATRATFVLYGRSVQRGIDHHELCTAFAYKKVDDGYLLMTAGHCFTPGAPVDATYLVAQGSIKDNPELESVDVLNHIDDGKMDVAELYLKTKKKYQILSLSVEPTKVDDKVFYVGYPEMISQVVFTGRVGSPVIGKACPEDDEQELCEGRFLVQTGGAPGASGSPVISERTGKVVGILEGHIFENGVVVVPMTSIESYYAKAGHGQTKNSQSEGSPQ